MSAAERTVLIITYEFPPAGGPGVQRAAKFAKYLPDNGWRPVVLTARPARSRPRDDSLAADVAGVDVHVTAGIELSEVVARALAPFKRGGGAGRGARSDTGVLPGPGSGTGPDAGALRSGTGPDPSPRPALSSRIAAWLSVPDDRMAWRWIASGPAARLAHAIAADAVFSTAPPYTAHLVAMRAARGRPWVADFRDPWTTSGHLFRPTAWHRGRDKRWERRVLARADAVTCISEPIAEALAGASRRAPVVIPNGFDPAELPEREPAPGLPIRMVYTGAFYGDRSPLPFLDGVAALVTRRPEARHQLAIELIGTTSARFADAVARRGIDDVVTLSDFRPHDESLAALARADVALLFIAPGDKSRATYTGKLFEYLGVGVPILAMAPEGVAADLIGRARAGIVVDPEAPDAIASAIEDLIVAKGAGSPGLAPPVAEVVAAYDRRVQAAMLARLLDDLVS